MASKRSSRSGRKAAPVSSASKRKRGSDKTQKSPMLIAKSQHIANSTQKEADKEVEEEVEIDGPAPIILYLERREAGSSQYTVNTYRLKEGSELSVTPAPCDMWLSVYSAGNRYASAITQCRVVGGLLSRFEIRSEALNVSTGTVFITILRVKKVCLSILLTAPLMSALRPSHPLTHSPAHPLPHTHTHPSTYSALHSTLYFLLHLSLYSTPCLAVSRALKSHRPHGDSLLPDRRHAVQLLRPHGKYGQYVRIVCLLALF